MLKIFKLFISFVFFGICIGLPIKDQEIDELIYRLQELKHQSRYNGGNEELITNQIHDDYGPRNWDALFGYQNRIDDIGQRNVQPYFGNVARRSMKQVDRLGGGMLLSGGRPNNNVEVNGTPEEAVEPIRRVNVGQNAIGRGMDRVQLRSLDHIGGGNLLKRSLDHIGGGNLLKRSLDSLETGDDAGRILKRAVDAIGGGYLLK
ncbi:uncharacterized protein LOC119071527 isoform X2 [Bradysia coprophila]|uniref:uncharacterized protein LOC119071527 isoform X2 n=1 Tax=Bradysia coprophila TaxID=38358 RepID=UPI00187DAC0E|nr:uncharacterized protein LOC119071527 isoform X2 [Bradysia coprophila]